MKENSNIMATFNSKELIALLLSKKIKYGTFEKVDTVDYIINDILERTNNDEVCFGFISENDYNILLEEYKKRKEKINE